MRSPGESLGLFAQRNIRVLSGQDADMRQIIASVPGKYRIWHPHELRMGAPDENGQDTAFRYLHTGTGYAVSQRVPCDGVRSLTFFCMFGAVTGTPTPGFIARVYPNDYDNDYGSVDLRAVGTAMTSGSSQQHSFDSRVAQSAVNNDLKPLMFQFLFRINDAALISPVSVWVIGGVD